jgi:hypothetical protein
VVGRAKTLVRNVGDGEAVGEGVNERTTLLRICNDLVLRLAELPLNTTA